MCRKKTCFTIIDTTLHLTLNMTILKFEHIFVSDTPHMNMSSVAPSTPGFSMLATPGSTKVSLSFIYKCKGWGKRGFSTRQGSNRFWEYDPRLTGMSALIWCFLLIFWALGFLHIISNIYSVWKCDILWQTCVT